MSDTDPDFLSDDAFNKWRCLIALAHVDEVLEKGEKRFFLDQFTGAEGFQASPEQMRVFMEDLAKPQPYQEFFDLIEAEEEKLDVLRLSHQLFWSDDDFAEQEAQACAYLRADMAAKLGCDAVALEKLVHEKLDYEVFMARAADLKQGAKGA